MEEMEAVKENSPKSSTSSFKTLVIVIVSLAIGAGIIFGVAKKKPEFLGLPKDSAQIQAEIDALVAEVGKLIALPGDEKPTVATITDVEKLKDQTFFKNAVNGDKVIIYTNARKAILYRPSEKKIMEVGAVNINQASPLPSGEATVKPTVVPTATATPVATPGE